MRILLTKCLPTSLHGLHQIIVRRTRRLQQNVYQPFFKLFSKPILTTTYVIYLLLFATSPVLFQLCFVYFPISSSFLGHLRESLGRFLQCLRYNTHFHYFANSLLLILAFLISLLKTSNYQKFSKIRLLWESCRFHSQQPTTCSNLIT